MLGRHHSESDPSSSSGPAQTGATPAADDDLTSAPVPTESQYSSGALDGLPEAGRERMARMREDSESGFFTSDLSVDEFLLVREAGFRPLGMVLGSSIYHVGLQTSSFNKSMELSGLTAAMYEARDLAMTRMEEEADQLGADGVVGVRLTISRYSWGEDLAEFMAVGTAIKHENGEALHRTPDGRPFTSNMSGQSFAKLLRAGYRPLGLTMGNCVYHVAHQGMRQTMRQAGRNVEQPQFTQALYEGRELAMYRMQDEAKALQAEGLVSVSLVEASHGWGSHIIEFFAIATAVTPTSEEHKIERPSLVLTLG